MKKLFLILSLLLTISSVHAQTRPAWLQIAGVPHIDVRSIGAKGDGLTNDTASLQEALTTYKHVLIPPGFTFCSDALTMPEGCSIVGGGTIKARAVAQSFLVASGASNISVSGIKLEGITVNPTAYSANAAIELTNGNNIAITDCHIYNANSVCVRFSNCKYSHFDRNFVDTCALGPRIRGSHYITINNNVISGRNTPIDAYGAGVYFDSTDGHSYGVSTNCTVSGNTITGIGWGNSIGGHAGENISISGNSLSDSTRGVSFGSFNAADNIYDIAIVGNTFRGSTTFPSDSYVGYSVSGATTNFARNISIVGNCAAQISPPTTASGSYGLRLTDCIYSQITGNTITTWSNNEAGAGLLIGNNTKWSTISNNNFSGGAGVVASYGINIIGTNTADLVISNNTFSYTTGGISVGAAADGLLGYFNDNRFLTGVVNGYQSAYTVYGFPRNTITSTGTIPLGTSTDIIFSHSAATDISTFSHILPGIIYNVRFASTTTTLKNGSAIQLGRGGIDFVGTATNSITLIGRSADIVQEITRAE